MEGINKFERYETQNMKVIYLRFRYFKESRRLIVLCQSCIINFAVLYNYIGQLCALVTQTKYIMIKNSYIVFMTL